MLLTDEPSADCDSLVSTSGPPATNISSFQFESLPVQDVFRHSNESSGSRFCSFSVTTRLFSKHFIHWDLWVFTSHRPIIPLSFKRDEESTCLRWANWDQSGPSRDTRGKIVSSCQNRQWQNLFRPSAVLFNGSFGRRLPNLTCQQDGAPSHLRLWVLIWLQYKQTLWLSYVCRTTSIKSVQAWSLFPRLEKSFRAV